MMSDASSNGTDDQQQQIVSEFLAAQHHDSASAAPAVASSASASAGRNIRNPLVGISSDRIRRAVWPVMLSRTADAHLSATERKKKKKREAAAAKQQQHQQQRSGSSNAFESRSTSTVAAPDSATSTVNNNVDDAAAADPNTPATATAAAAAAADPTTTTTPDFVFAPGAQLMSVADATHRINTARQKGQELRDAFPPQCCAHIVEADVNRSLYEVQEGALRDALRGVLMRTLLRVCASDPELHYYQGLHDIATVLLRVYFDDRIAKFGAAGLLTSSAAAKSNSSTAKLSNSNAHAPSASASAASASAAASSSSTVAAGAAAAAAKLEERFARSLFELSQVRLKRFCGICMSETTKLLVAMHGVLQQVSPRLARLLERRDVAPSWNFALSWLITWFSHDISHDASHLVLRTIFDFLVQTNENMIIFVCVSMLVHLFKINDAEYDAHRFGALICSDASIDAVPSYVLADFGMLHCHLKKLPSLLLTFQSPSSHGDGKSIEHLHRIFETALKLERAHKTLLLYLLDDPHARVNLFPVFDDDDFAEQLLTPALTTSRPPQQKTLTHEQRQQLFAAQNQQQFREDQKQQQQQQQQQQELQDQEGIGFGTMLRGGMQMALVVGFVASAAAGRIIVDNYSRFGTFASGSTGQ